MNKGDKKKLKRRYQKRYSDISDTDLEILFQQYHHFISIKIENKDWDGKKFAPSLQVAQMWEMHICDTESYLRCCGKNFLQFDPDFVYNQTTVEFARAYARLYRKLCSDSQYRVFIWPEPLEESVYEFSNKDGSLGFQLKAFSDGHHNNQIADVIRYIKTETQAPKYVPCQVVDTQTERFKLKFGTSFNSEFWMEIPTTMTISDLEKQISKLIRLATSKFCLVTAERLDYNGEKAVSHYFSEGDAIYVAISEE